MVEDRHTPPSPTAGDDRDPAPRPAGRHHLPNDVSGRTLRKALGGDNRAFAQVIEHYDRRLRGFVHELLDHPVGGVDDLLHAAYLRAYRSLPRLSPDRSAGAWLYRIAYRACGDELRRQERTRAKRATPTAPPVTEPVARVLRAPPVEDRALVLMIDRDGFDYRAAAEVLDTEAAGLERRLARTRRALHSAAALVAMPPRPSEPAPTADASPAGIDPETTAAGRAGQPASKPARPAVEAADRVAAAPEAVAPIAAASEAATPEDRDLEPTGPTEQAHPTDPTEQSHPHYPTGPADPPGPRDPSYPTDPTGPQDPAYPTDPTGPQALPGPQDPADEPDSTHELGSIDPPDLADEPEPVAPRTIAAGVVFAPPPAQHPSASAAAGGDVTHVIRRALDGPAGPDPADDPDAGPAGPAGHEGPVQRGGGA